MKRIVLLLALLASASGFSQTVNDYKYVVVPEKFDFLKEGNQYNLNQLTKMLFEKYGFEVYFETDHKPAELALDRCRALYGNLVSESGMLSTGLYITLSDCNGKVLFKSEKGKSKQKEFRKAYHQALREASQSLDGMNYTYSAKEVFTPAAEMKTTQTATAQTPVSNENMLFAQPIANGYQLVDSTPKVVLKIYKTSQQDSFTAVSDTKNGVVFKKGNDWYFEYYENDRLVSEKLDIKF